nr:MAG TPA: hypothetical protein [Caudoviricetes sp.]
MKMTARSIRPSRTLLSILFSLLQKLVHVDTKGKCKLDFLKYNTFRC